MPDLIDDRYEPLEVLASGGMASVWCARDTRLDRIVALKRPHPSPPDDPVHQRMEGEARAAAALSHPNLVTVYDFGRDEAGPYLVMEMVEGPQLAAVAGDIGPVEAVEIGTQIAKAVATLHEAGIIHRDIKPANVLMSDRGPLLTDFGIAVDVDAASRLTAPGKVVATPSYAAPEVMAGEPPGPSSDVFSLAVLIYELVAGVPPYPGNDYSQAPKPLEDNHLDQVLRQALSRSPADRPSADELAARLSRAAPTVATVAASGSTLIMESVPLRLTGPPAGEEAEQSQIRWLRLPVVAALVALTLGAVAMSLVADTAPTTAALVGDTTTSTTAPATTTTTTTTSTTATVEEARDRLESILAASHPSQLNPRKVRDIMKKVDEAIRAAEKGDLKEAKKKLREVHEKLGDLNDTRRAEAVAALDDLAALLGLTIDWDERRRRDD